MHENLEGRSSCSLPLSEGDESFNTSIGMGEPVEGSIQEEQRDGGYHDHQDTM